MESILSMIALALIIGLAIYGGAMIGITLLLEHFNRKDEEE